MRTKLIHLVKGLSFYETAPFYGCIQKEAKATKEDDLLTMRQYGRNVVIYTDAIHRADEKNSM